jgi:hypothetical protein
MPSPRDQRRRRILRLLWGAIAVLYVVSIPWYRRGGDAPALWLGLPDWVAVAVGCYLAVAVPNAAAWLLAEVPDAEPDTERDARRDGPEDAP